MNNTSGKFISLCVFLVYVLYFSTSVFSKDFVRLMSYNINNETQPGSDIIRNTEIAKYIVQNEIDIVLLQEVKDWRVTGASDFDNTWDIYRNLQSLNYRMEPFYKSYTKSDQDFKVVTFSKYRPLVDSYLSFSLGADTKRSGVVTSFYTDIGPMKIINLHPRSGSTVCGTFDILNNLVTNSFNNDPSIVVGGDMNQFNCEEKWNNTFIKNYKMWCTSPYCSSSNTLDWFFSPKQNKYTMLSFQKGVLGVSDHAPLLIDLKLTDGSANVAPQRYSNSLSLLDLIDVIKHIFSSNTYIETYDKNRDTLIDTKDIIILIKDIFI